jgi:hypothetical protein
VLLSTLNYDHPQKGMSQAFSSLFPEVREYDYLKLQREGRSQAEISQGLLAVVREFQPDWIWLQLQDSKTIGPESLVRIREEVPRTVISHWMGDCQPSPSPYMASICRVTHLTLLSNVGQLPLYRAAGAKKAHYCQIGVDWDEDVLGIPEWTPPFRIPEIVLCGNFYGNRFPGTADRVDAIQALMAEKLDVGIVGWGWPPEFPVVGGCTVKKQHHVWRRAKVALNVNHFNDIELYYSDRQLIAMASGTPLVCAYVPGLEREFREGMDCLWYREPDELVAKVKDLLGSEEMRIRIGREGRSTILRRHTWWHRILEILPVVEEIRSGLPEPISASPAEPLGEPVPELKST